MRTDRAEALGQRVLPMAECPASLLAPICDQMTGLFRSETKPDAGGGETGFGPGEREESR